MEIDLGYCTRNFVFAVPCVDSHPHSPIGNDVGQSSFGGNHLSERTHSRLNHIMGISEKQSMAAYRFLQTVLAPFRDPGYS